MRSRFPRRGVRTGQPRQWSELYSQHLQSSQPRLKPPEHREVASHLRAPGEPFPEPSARLKPGLSNQVGIDVGDPPLRTSIGWGCLGLVLLGALIWGVSELGHLPLLVEAQEPQAEVAALSPSPWKAASFPVEDFVAYTSPFGYRQHPFGGTSFHYGLDIAAPMGSYIRAWWEGQVVEVTDDTACGTSIVIESEDWLHIYCHMQGHVVVEVDGDRWLVDHDGGIQIRQGDRVHSGQRIGRIGMTGRTTGPHLHWGMKYQGTWVDPALVVRAMVEE